MRLFGFERRWMVTIFESIVPSGASETLTLGAADLPMARYVDDLVAASPGRVALGYRAAAWIIVIAGPLLAGRFGLFTMLGPDERAEVLAELEQSRFYVLRELPTLYKMLVVLGYCGAPEVQRQLGVPVADEPPPEWMR